MGYVARGTESDNQNQHTFVMTLNEQKENNWEVRFTTIFFKVFNGDLNYFTNNHLYVKIMFMNEKIFVVAKFFRKTFFF